MANELELNDQRVEFIADYGKSMSFIILKFFLFNLLNLKSLKLTHIPLFLFSSQVDQAEIR